MRTLYIVLNLIVLFCNLSALIVVLNDYFKKNKLVRKMKRYIKKDRITKSHIHLIYGIAEIEKGNKKL